MTRKWICLTIASALLAAALLFWAGSMLFRQAAPSPSPDGTASTAPTPDAASPAAYTLREYEGKLAVFRGDSRAPYQIYDVSVSTLPEYDRTLLKEGIPADTPAQLDRLIEDYTS